MMEQTQPPGHSRALGDDTLIFLHLPKTGGTALRTSLRRAFDPAATALVYPADDLDGAMTREQFAALSREDLERLRLVMGHLSYGVHRRLSHPCRYATIVREPVDRIVSLYYHYRNLPGVRFMSKGHRERLRLRLRRVSLEDWVFSERRIPADNLMVRNVTGARGIAFGACTEALFEQAMEHIERDFAAIVGEGAEPGFDLLQLTGWIVLRIRCKGRNQQKNEESQ